MESESIPNSQKQTAMAAEPAEPSKSRLEPEVATAEPSAVSAQSAVAPVLPEAPTAVVGQVALESHSAPHKALEVKSGPAVVMPEASVTPSGADVVVSEPAVVTPNPAVIMSEPAVGAPEAAVIMSEPAVVMPEAALASSESARVSFEPVEEVSEPALGEPGARMVSEEDSQEMVQGKQGPQTGKQQLSDAAAAVDAAALTHTTSEGEFCFVLDSSRVLLACCMKRCHGLNQKHLLEQGCGVLCAKGQTSSLTQSRTSSKLPAYC